MIQKICILKTEVFCVLSKTLMILHIIKHKTKKSDVTLYLRNERAQRVDFGICHKQNIGEEPGQVKFGVRPDEAPGNPKKWSKICFLSSAKDTRVPRGLNFGYVLGFKLVLNMYLVDNRTGPNEDPQDHPLLVNK